MKAKQWLLFVAVLMLLLSASIHSANGPVVKPGYDSKAIIAAQLKYRALINPAGLNGYEGVLGIPVSYYPNYNPAAYNDFYRGAACDGSTPYGWWLATNHVKFTYDGAGTLNAQVDANPSYCMTISPGSLGSLNYLQLDVVNRATGTTVNFNNVTLNGTLLPTSNFTGSGWSTWQVTGINLTTGFTLEGDLGLAWPTTPATSGQETNKLVIQVGYVPPAPPDCKEAYASTETLWPPNHEFWPIKILGVTGDDVTIIIDSIYQDEPVDSTGDGAFAPDGNGVGTDTASVRAERDGGGNGRVYHMRFHATNPGGSCSGEVLVTVPKSKGKDGAAVDDGALYDSTRY